MPIDGLKEAAIETAVNHLLYCLRDIESDHTSYMLSSLLRYFESGLNGRRIRIKKSPHLLKSQAVLTQQSQASDITCYISTAAGSANPKTNFSNSIRGLIAHELAHFLLTHTEEFAFARNSMSQELDRREEGALSTMWHILQLHETEADAFAFTLLNCHGSVWERDYFHDNHSFLQSEHFSNSFEKLGVDDFHGIRKRLISEKMIHDPEEKVLRCMKKLSRNGIDPEATEEYAKALCREYRT
jgi:hypothetical protein